MCDVVRWLQRVGLGEFVGVFEKHQITGVGLQVITKEDLVDMGVELVGDRKRLLSALSVFGNQVPAPREETDAGDSRIPVRDLLQLLQACTKLQPQQKDSEDDSGSRLDMNKPFNTLQKNILRSCEKNPWWLDPSRWKYAESEWASFAEWHDIDDVLQGHDRISPTFMHGDHEGQHVDDLIEDLVNGVVRPSQLTTIVAARVTGRLYTVYGNRRLYALREYSKRCRGNNDKPEQIKVIVHPAPFEHLDLKTRNQFIAKVVLACSTSNHGQQAYCRV